MLIKLSDERINEHFTNGQIKGYMQEHNLTEIESILYLWFYNYAHVMLADFKEDCGRKMFVKFAKCAGDLITKLKE